MSLSPRTQIFAAAAAAAICAPLLGQASPAAAEVAYHNVEYSVEASGGDGTVAARYTVDQHDHTNPAENRLEQDVVGLPWTASFRIGEADYQAGKPVPDSKPFRGLDLGLTVTAEDPALTDALTDGGGRLEGLQAWDAWNGGQSFQNYYTCRITVDGKVVAEQTMKGLCSAQYKQRSRPAS